MLNCVFCFTTEKLSSLKQCRQKFCNSLNASTFTVLLCFKNTLPCAVHHNSKHVLPVYKKNLYILITFPLHKSSCKMTKKSLKTKLFSISGWNERLSNHRSCIKRMRGKLAKDCIKCLKHRVGPVTLSAADSTVFFFFATTQIYIKCESPGKKYSEITIQATHKVIIVKIFIFFVNQFHEKINNCYILEVVRTNIHIGWKHK